MATADPAPDWRRTLPALLLAGYLVAMPFQFEWGVYRQITPADAFIAAYLAVRLPHLRHVPRAWTTWHIALLPLLGLGAMVALVRTGELTSYALLQKGVGLVALLVTGACFIDFMRDWDRVRWVLRVFVGAVLLHATVALAAQVLVYAGGPTLPLLNAPWPGERISGLVLDANAFGGLVALALVLHHVTAGGPSALLTGRTAWWGYAVLPVTLLLTFSRSAWLGLAVGLLTIAVVRPGVGGRTLVVGLIPVAVLAPLVLSRIPASADLVTRPSEIASRLVIGQEALRGFVESPVFGIGLGVYVSEYEIVVHNTALWFLSDLGALGLAVFLGLVVTVTARLVNGLHAAPRDARPLLLALLCGHAVMCGLSLGIEAFYQRHWWLVFAAAGVCYSLSTTGKPSAAAGHETAFTR